MIDLKVTIVIELPIKEIIKVLNEYEDANLTEESLAANPKLFKYIKDEWQEAQTSFITDGNSVREDWNGDTWCDIQDYL